MKMPPSDSPKSSYTEPAPRKDVVIQVIVKDIGEQLEGDTALGLITKMSQLEVVNGQYKGRKLWVSLGRSTDLIKPEIFGHVGAILEIRIDAGVIDGEGATVPARQVTILQVIHDERSQLE